MPAKIFKVHAEMCTILYSFISICAQVLFFVLKYIATLYLMCLFYLALKWRLFSAVTTLKRYRKLRRLDIKPFFLQDWCRLFAVFNVFSTNLSVNDGSTRNMANVFCKLIAFSRVGIIFNLNNLFCMSCLDEKGANKPSHTLTGELCLSLHRV